MHFRFYGGSMGRFMRPDTILGNLANPQSWNLYSYVHGNPVNFNDPTGHLVGIAWRSYYSAGGEGPCAGGGNHMEANALGGGLGLESSPLDAGYAGPGFDSWFGLAGMTSGHSGGGGGGAATAVPSYRLEWINEHKEDATVVAKELEVTTAAILGLSAVESGWGKGRFAKEGNNFFGQHAPQPGALPETIQASGDAKIKMATYSSYLASAKSFATAYGHLVKGVKDSATFVARLQNAGKFGIGGGGKPVAGYVTSVSATIRALAAAMGE